jgi:hypothetical protein
MYDSINIAHGDTKHNLLTTPSHRHVIRNDIEIDILHEFKTDGHNSYFPGRYDSHKGPSKTSVLIEPFVAFLIFFNEFINQIGCRKIRFDRNTRPLFV